MGSLFDNVEIIFFFAAIGVISYSKFDEQQKIIIIYTCLFLLFMLNITSFISTIILLTIIIFIYTEYLSEDSEKLVYINNVRYKIVDFAFISIFQYEILTIILSLSVNYIFISNFNEIKLIGQLLAILIFYIGLHRLSVQKFKIHRFTDIIILFNDIPLNEFQKRQIDENFYQLIVDVEDSTYFARTKTYTSISFEYMKLKLRNKKLSGKIKKIVQVSNSIIFGKRGMSTLEMQLIRNIGLVRGYNRTLRRKVFEIIYTEIWIKSIYKYYKNNFYVNRNNFKYYLLYIYINNVRISIDGVEYKSINSYMKIKDSEEKQIGKLECFFVACCGLKWAKSTKVHVDNMKQLIEKYDMDYSIINEYLDDNIKYKDFIYNDNEESQKEEDFIKNNN